MSIGLAGSVLGFLRHNFYPAKIFMGDSGSMFIGLLIAAMSLVSSQKTAIGFAILIPILALGYPILDTSLAVFRRLRAGKHIFTADREHIHHILIEYGYSQRKAVTILYVVCFCFAVMAFLFAQFNRYDTFIMGVLIFAAMFTLLFVRFLSLAKNQIRSNGDKGEETVEAGGIHAAELPNSHN